MSRTAEYEAVRAEATEWLRANWDPGATVQEWWARLAGSGWGFPAWPSSWFGRDLPASLVATVKEAFDEVGALAPPLQLTSHCLVHHGTEDQKRRFLTPMARGEELCCQLLSEPDAGSDLASLRTSAVADGDGWVVNGQKVWISHAHWADRALLLARTDPGVAKHAGITAFIIDMDQPGIDVRAMRQMDERHQFNEVFLRDVHVDTDRVLGEVNGGWTVAKTSLTFERFAIGARKAVYPGHKAGMLSRPAGSAVPASVSRHDDGPHAWDYRAMVFDAAHRSGTTVDPVRRQGLVRLHTQMELLRLLDERAAAAMRADTRPGWEGSIRKLVRADMLRTARDLSLAALGPHGMLKGHDAPDDGNYYTLAMFSPCQSIAGGTDEIQRNTLAERVLGLPRDPEER